MWGIHPKETQKLIGTITLYNIDRKHGSCYFGILIGDRAYWGTGASTEAIRLVTDFAFGPLGLRRVTAGTYAPNHGIHFVMKRLGFRREGTLKQAYVMSPGVFVDGYMWALLADEWQASQARLRAE